MERIQFVQHKGKNILLEDFTKLSPGTEMIETIGVARKIIHSQPPKSVLAVLDATDAHYDNDTIGAMREFVNANTPYMKAASVVGITGLLGIALSAITQFSGRSFKTFKTREEAMDWLTEQ
jgi:hypothetical protein